MSDAAATAARNDPARRPLPGERAQKIACAFLPDWPLGNRYHYYYAQAKLRSDPLYPGVLNAHLRTAFTSREQQKPTGITPFDRLHLSLTNTAR